MLNRLADWMTPEGRRLYRAMIWTNTEPAGERVTVLATSLAEAKQQLEDKYGEGTVFDLHNEDDANRSR